MKGKVKFFNAMRGFGFIASDDGKEYFVHQSGLKDGVEIAENDAVSFDVEQGDRGPKAVNVGKEEAGAATEEPATEEKAEEPAEEKEEEKKE